MNKKYRKLMHQRQRQEKRWSGNSLSGVLSRIRERSSVWKLSFHPPLKSYAPEEIGSFLRERSYVIRIYPQNTNCKLLTS
jgi:hypothetical protein